MIWLLGTCECEEFYRLVFDSCRSERSCSPPRCLACLLDSPVKCDQALVRFLKILFDGVAYPAFIASIRFRRIFPGFNRNPQFHGHEGETLQR